MSSFEKPEPESDSHDAQKPLSESHSKEGADDSQGFLMDDVSLPEELEPLPSEETEIPDVPESIALEKKVPSKPKVSLWEQLNTPIYLRKYYRPWMLPVFSLALIGALGYGFWNMSPSNPAAVEPPKTSDEQIELRFFGVELRGRKEGTPFFTILADKVDVSRDQRYVTFLMNGDQKPHGEFFNLKDWEEDEENPSDSGKRRSILWQSETAVYDFNMEKLTMKDKVEIVTDLQDLILTDEMIWSKKEDLMESSTRSKITTHHKTYMESDQLKVETKEKTLYLEGKVYIEMSLGKDQRIDVEEALNH